MTVHDLIADVAFLIARYLHIICTTMLVGGTLFYEMVVPIAIGDMKEEQQLAVMGRSRWVFRWIVWVSCILLLISGIASTARQWPSYSDENMLSTDIPALSGESSQIPHNSLAAMRPGWWWVAHASTGFIAILIALSLTWSRTPPAHPIQWMRLNLVVLMIVIFLGSVAREVHLAITERMASKSNMSRVYMPVPGSTEPGKN